MTERSTPTKKPVATRLPKDDYDRLEAYCDEKGISQADALRRFLTTQHHLSERDGDDDESFLRRLMSR